METNNIVISSRIRLARSLKNYPFSNNTNLEKANDVLVKAFNAINNVGNFNTYRLKNLSQLALEEMLEDHLISSQLIENSDISGVAISDDKTVSIMVNEEDHLREQCLLSGLDLKRAYDIINDIDNELNISLNFDYDKNFGYLTACPTNVGTGIRASVMMFLPGICLTNNFEEMVNAVSKLGICVRGAYGEGSQANGYVFQISNQFSLGKTEDEIIQLVESTVLKICDLEKKARNNLMANNENKLTDDVFRAYGVLSNCYLIGSNEACELLSKLKLGVALNKINLKNPEIIDELLKNISACKINGMSGANLSAIERDKSRAQYLGRVLKNMRI